MNQDDIEEDTMVLKFLCDPDGGMSVAAGYNFTDDMPDDVRGGYMLLLQGMMAMLEVEPEVLLKASLYADFGADLERRMQRDDEKPKPNLSVVDIKSRVQ